LTGRHLDCLDGKSSAEFVRDRKLTCYLLNFRLSW